MRDILANGDVFMDSRHAHIHEGVSYHWSHKWAAVANNAIINMMIQVASGDALHLFFGGRADGICYLDLLSISSYTGGTSQQPYNRNLFKTHVASANFFYDPTTLNVVSQTLQETIFGGNNQAILSNNLFEWILCPGNYAIRATNKAGSSTDIAIEVEFYSPRNRG